MLRIDLIICAFRANMCTTERENTENGGNTMKTKFYLDGKKTTKKALIEKIGKERLDLMVGEAKEGFFTDPL